MLFPAILLLPAFSAVAAQQCSSSSDCQTQDAPYCSRWGWCQWTAQYGEAGPSQSESEDAPLGSCRSAQDCTPRAPVCSREGFCTARHYGQQAPDNSRGNRISQTVSNQGSKGQTISRPRNNQQPHQTAGTVSGSSRRASRTHEQFLKSQSNHLDLSVERDIVTNNFKRSSRRDNSNHRNINQIKQKPSKRRLEPIPAVPDQTTKSSRNLPQIFKPLIAVPVPGIQRRVPSTTIKTTTVPTPDYIDRSSTDYYDNYDYNYYTEFEVMKKEEPIVLKTQTRGESQTFKNQRESSSRSRSQQQPRPGARQAPKANVSQGCLADCVTDCVAIEQLTAYRDCVEFCGRTCKNKK